MNALTMWPLIVSLVIFVAAYAAVVLEKAHRTILALTGASAMIVLGSWLSFYDVHRAIAAIDFDTIVLLLSMMIIVGLFKGTGFFEYLALRAAKRAGGRPWRLLVSLGLVTTLISMALDNVTTIIILVPVTVSLADLLGVSPIPYLMTEVLLSNIGGVATLIGDPPNILIGSAAGFGFLDFLTHTGPIVVLAWAVAQAALLLIYRRELAVVPTGLDALNAMDARRAISDSKTTRRMLIVLGGTILLFLLHEHIGLNPGLVALCGACAGLLWVRPDFDRVLREVRWDVLLFFISLFVLVGGLNASGAVGAVGRIVARLGAYSLPLAIIAVLWLGALASGLISNIPFTIALLPVIQSLSGHGIAMEPLWWALAVGVGFGANMTPFGSAANLVVVGVSDTMGERLRVGRWIRSGSVVAVLTCLLGTGAILLAVRLGLM